MDLFFKVCGYLSDWRQKTVTLLREPDATATLQSWHVFDKGEQRWATQALLENPLDAATPAHDWGPGSGEKKTPALTLWTWNVDAFEKYPEDRMSGIIATIQNHDVSPPDVLFFQEVSRAALDFLLAHSWIRENWYVSEAGPANWAKPQSYGTVTLLLKRTFDCENGTGTDTDTSKARIGLVWRVRYPTRFDRDALCCDVFLRPAGVPVRLRPINVHLDSLPIRPSLRPRQLAIVAGMLHSAGRGVVAGDFNPVLLEDDALVAENRLVDAWSELYPGENGYTWGADGQQPFPPSRLDKIAMVGLKAREVVVIFPGMLTKRGESSQAGEGQLGSGKREEDNSRKASEFIPWSDHSGLRCIFSLVDVEPL